MRPVQVLVVDDSMFMRRIISDLIVDNPAFAVIGTAKNGKEAIALTKQLKPDVITMDVEMPEMNGLEALVRIMAEQPTPVIMLSSLTVEGAEVTIRALEAGAIDFVRKPSGSISLDLYKVKLLLHEKLTIAAKSRISPPAAPPPVPKPAQPPAPLPLPTAKQPLPGVIDRNVASSLMRFEHIVAIGTSTGGPKALQQVLRQLPATFPAPILVVQHMPPNFTKSLAGRLDSLCSIRVVEAEEAMPLMKGTAYIAPGGYHMTLEAAAGDGYRIRLSKDEPRSGHRPSVDTMFDSLVPFGELKRHIVLMTGMGSDGAKGMKALREAGAATTIAEAEETCVVYGMPRSAVELGCAGYVLPQQEISEKLIEQIMK